MIQPKAIIFDLGKVLLDFDYRIAGRKLAARSNKAAEEFTDLLMQPHLLLEYETGLLNEEEFFQAVCKATGYLGNFSEFSSSFGDIFTPIEPMIALHAELKQKGYPTYIFSNTNQLAVDHVRKQYPFFANFDGYVFSFEHHCMKPNPGLYEAAERRSGSSGPEILYLDDRLENIEAGSVRAWQTILHETPEKSRGLIEELGMLNKARRPSGTSTC
jgi:FMN phosphatase YigB (HAD superfamily)